MQCNTIGDIPQFVDHFGAYTLIEADGTRHPFPGAYPLSVGSTGCASTPPGTIVKSNDGSGWILRIGFTQNDLFPVSAVRKDGMVINFSQDGRGNEVSAVDRNGNVLSAGTDTLGRSLPAGGSYSDSNGNLQSFTITTVQVPVQTALCGFYGLGSSKCQEDKASLSLPSVIQLPDGLTYQFTYAQNQYGEPTSVTLPTGAQISWTWGALDSGGRKVTSRTVTVGGQSFTWTYNYGFSGNVPGTAPWVNSMTDPLGNETDYTCREPDVARLPVLTARAFGVSADLRMTRSTACWPPPIQNRALLPISTIQMGICCRRFRRRPIRPAHSSTP